MVRGNGISVATEGDCASVEGDKAVWAFASTSASRIIDPKSTLCRNSNASSSLFFVGRLITPSVRCSVPNGLCAASGISGVRATPAPAAAVSKASGIEDLNSSREVTSCGMDVELMSGRQRKCVRRGLLSWLWFRGLWLMVNDREKTRIEMVLVLRTVFQGCLNMGMHPV